MALQQVIPDFVPASGLGVGQVRPLKRMVKPVQVSFRKGGSLGALVATVMANRSVAVEASAGAGKSTLVPGALLDASGGLLVHVLPSFFLARELFKHVSLNRSGCFLLGSVGDEWPAAGWVFTCASVIQAKFLTAGSMVMPECVLYHDEVHRSDAWTNLLAHQWGTITGVLKYVTASATAGHTGFRKLEPGGVVDIRTFSYDYVEKTLDVYTDSTVPWAVDAITGNTLIFEDRAEQSAYLVKEYSRAGFDVFRLHSRMKLTVFDAAMCSLKSGAITVLVADSTFRDGYTFDLSCIVDMAIIQTTSVVDSKPARVSRVAYEGEVYQAAARGGRTAGSAVVAWRPDVVFERKRVALEEVEMDAVALVSRMLCTLVPLDASDSILAEGNVPRDLMGSLQGTQPLACLAGTQTAPLAASGYVRAPSPVLQQGVDVTTKGTDYYHIGVTADVANRLHRYVASKPAEAEPSTGPSTDWSAQSASTAPTDWTGELATWAADAASKEVEFQSGKYYYSPSVRPDVVASVELPDGWASVVKLFGPEHGSLVSCDMSHRMRDVAIAAGLQRFNLLSCEMSALMAVIRDVKALGRTRSAPMVHAWLNQLFERVSAISVESGTVARLVTGFVSNYCELVELPSGCLDAECKAMASGLFESLRNIPVSDVLPESAVHAVRAALPEQRSQQFVTSPLVAGASDQRYVEMARRGRTARVKPPLNSFGRWVVGYDHNAHTKRLVDSKR